MNREKMVQDIFDMRKDGCTLEEIGEKFKKTREWARLVLNGSLYGNISKKLNLVVETKVKLKKDRLTEEQIIKVFKLRCEGHGPKAISTQTKLEVAKIVKLLRGDYSEYKDIIKKHQFRIGFRRFQEEEIVEIFNMDKKGISTIQIAIHFDVSQTYISEILLGHQYKDVIQKYKLKPRKRRKKLSEKDIINIFYMNKNERKHPEIAKKYQISIAMVNAILHGRCYRPVIEKHNLMKKAS